MRENWGSLSPGDAVDAVCLAPGQFSCWNALRASNAADKVSGEAYQRAKRAWEVSETSNLTRGATSYYAPRLASPKWASKGRNKVVIGNHVFMKVS